MTIIDVTSYTSHNYDERPKGEVSCIVFHDGEGNKASDLTKLCNASVVQSKRVSAHYYVDRAGNIYQLVPPHKRAWHAGASAYLGRIAFNDFSVGVESEHKEGQDWPKVQVDSLSDLFRTLIGQYNIKEQWVTTHKWIAFPEGRKSDPTNWTNEDLHKWIHGLYVQPSHNLPGLVRPMECGLGFYNFYMTNGGFNLFGYALTPETAAIDSLGRECTWMRFERVVFKYVYGEGVHLALLVEAFNMKWAI